MPQLLNQQGTSRSKALNKSSQRFVFQDVEALSLKHSNGIIS